MTDLRALTPKDKAAAMVAAYGTPNEALHVARRCRGMHAEGSHSALWWSAVLDALRKAGTGKPRSKAQRRKLREARK